MRTHALLSALILIVLTASCASQPSTPQKLEGQSTQYSPSTRPTTTASALSVIATSGDEPVSTDPETFSLASGGLQLVEFFSYT